MPDIPITAVDDPVSGYEPLAIAAASDAKMRRALATRTIGLAWFGIGDNPYFPVGVADLAAFAAELSAFGRHGWTARLTLVTNARPFEQGGLAALRALGVDHAVTEWTEAAERAALLDATVAVLPVNAQAFSRAKSLNRAITAINAGCQVLSLGFPLYERLDAFIYRSAGTLIDDIAHARCRLRSERIVDLTALLARIANPFEAASAFVGAARYATGHAPTRPAPPLLCVVHGRQTGIAVHKAAASIGGLSISTPFCHARWNFPVRFDVAGGRLQMRAATAVVRRFDLPVVGPRERTMRIHDLDFLEVDQPALGIAPMRLFQTLGESAFRDVALYEDVMRQVDRCCRAAFGEVDPILSDANPVKRVARPRLQPA